MMMMIMMGHLPKDRAIDFYAP